MADRAALDKPGALAGALRLAGFGEVAVALVEVPAQSRRRFDLAAARQGAAILLGLHARRSREVVDMRECVLLTPELFALVAPLRALLRHLEGFRRAGSVVVNWLDEGPDILLRLDFDVTGPDRAKLIAFAKAWNGVRLAVAKGDGAAEPVAMLRPATVTFANVPVLVAPGAFLQASAAGETAIAAAVLAGLPRLKAKAWIVELYAGVGTLSFPLARLGRVAAYEGAAEAAAAQDAAIRANGLAGRMRVEQRDLARRPLKVAEMAGAAALVLDPPYAGAGPQMKNLVEAGVKRVIYVSCNPAALTQDARLLAQAGYGVVTATAIDQFAYSENLESVVVFERV